jgi:hypothetical protein
LRQVLKTCLHFYAKSLFGWDAKIRQPNRENLKQNITGSKREIKKTAKTNCLKKIKFQISAQI